MDETLKANPPKDKPTNVQPSAINSDFMALVTAEMDRTGKSYRDCYLAMRKRYPDVFDRWLEAQQVK